MLGETSADEKVTRKQRPAPIPFRPGPDSGETFRGSASTRTGAQSALRAGQTVRTMPRLTKTDATKAASGGRNTQAEAARGGQKMMAASRAAIDRGSSFFR